MSLMPSSSMRSRAAWRAGRLAWMSVMTATASGESREQFLEEVEHLIGDVLADGADGGEVLAGGVGDGPIDVPRAGMDRATVAAAHRDDEVGSAHDLVGQRLGE